MDTKFLRTLNLKFLKNYTTYKLETPPLTTLFHALLPDILQSLSENF